MLPPVAAESATALRNSDLRRCSTVSPAQPSAAPLRCHLDLCEPSWSGAVSEPFILQPAFHSRCHHEGFRLDKTAFRWTKLHLQIDDNKHGSMPSEPATLNDHEIPEKWRSTIEQDLTEFLLYDSGRQNESRVVIFGSSAQLQHLAYADTCTWTGTTPWHHVSSSNCTKYGIVSHNSCDMCLRPSYRCVVSLI